MIRSKILLIARRRGKPYGNIVAGLSDLSWPPLDTVFGLIQKGSSYMLFVFCLLLLKTIQQDQQRFHSEGSTE